MTLSEFVEYLVERCDTAGSTTAVSALLTAANAAIDSGGAIQSTLTSSGLNGKSFNRAIQFPPIDVARACQMALKIYADTETEVASSYADFRDLQR